MLRYQFPLRYAAAPSLKAQHDGYLLIIEDKDDATVVGICWARVGIVHGLMTCLKDDRPNANLVNFTKCTLQAYSRTVDVLIQHALDGSWYRRSEAVEALLRDIERHQQIEMEDEESTEADARQPRRSRRKHVARYAEAVAAY